MTKFVFRLFITGKNPNHHHTADDLQAFCLRHLGADYELEIVDVLQNPEVAENHKILATPSLIRVRPLPSRRFIGDLGGCDRMLAQLRCEPTSYCEEECVVNHEARPL